MAAMDPFNAPKPSADAPAPAAPHGEPADGIGMGFPLPPDATAARAATRAVRDAFFGAHPWVVPTCMGMSGVELARLFAIYDERCFAGFLTRRLDALGCGAPIFGFSGRLTSSAGRTRRLTWTVPGPGGGGATVRRTTYRIDVSIPLLVDSFRGAAHREIDVCGLACADAFDALQRVLEHELIHLLEFVAFDTTDCKGANFHFLASRTFGHTVMLHGLVTPRERAYVELGIRAGDRVAFEHAGVRRVGWVERIRRRATVRVAAPCPSGSGHVLYEKYFVPLSMLSRADA